jgi:hypothetical protein
MKQGVGFAHRMTLKHPIASANFGPPEDSTKSLFSQYVQFSTSIRTSYRTNCNAIHVFVSFSSILHHAQMGHNMASYTRCRKSQPTFKFSFLSEPGSHIVSDEALMYFIGDALLEK